MKHPERVRTIVNIVLLLLSLAGFGYAFGVGVPRCREEITFGAKFLLTLPLLPLLFMLLVVLTIVALPIILLFTQDTEKIFGWIPGALQKAVGLDGVDLKVIAAAVGLHVALPGAAGVVLLAVFLGRQFGRREKRCKPKKRRRKKQTDKMEC